MKISIFGLGYVGAVSLACLARDGHSVIGVDVDQTKLDLIRTGKTPVVEEGMVELMTRVAASGKVSVTTVSRIRGPVWQRWTTRTRYNPACSCRGCRMWNVAVTVSPLVVSRASPKLTSEPFWSHAKSPVWRAGGELVRRKENVTGCS